MPSPPSGQPAPKQPKDPRFADRGPIPLEPEPQVAPPPGRRGATPFCPFCERPLSPTATVCTGCGYSRATGARRTPVRPEGDGKPKYQPNPCRECGYDLNGVVNPTCPECDAPIRRSGLSLLADERGIARASYRKALIGIGVGLVGIVLIAGLQATPVALLGTLMCWPLAIVGYAVAKIFWDGLDEPWALLAVRALAVLAVVVAAAMLLMPISAAVAFRPWGIGRLVFIVFAAVAALDAACEEDLDDAVAYSIPFVIIGAFGPALLASLVL